MPNPLDGLKNYVGDVYPRQETNRQPSAISELLGLLDPRNYTSGQSDDFLSQLYPAMAQTAKNYATGTYNNMDALDKAALVASPIPAVGDAVGFINDARYFAQDPTLGNAALMGLGLIPMIPGMTAFHGSPHRFDKFDISKIGTGEGAQAYGHGLYFAESPDVAGQYRDTLTNFRPDHIESALVKRGVSPETANTYAQFTAKTKGGSRAMDDFEKFISEKGPSPYIEQFREKIRSELPRLKSEIESIKGTLYTVDIPDEAIDKMLDWDKPLSEQPKAVRDALVKIDPDTYSPNGNDYDPSELGYMVYERLVNNEAANLRARVRNGEYIADTTSSAKASASAKLKEMGIPGIRYLDAGSRSQSNGTRNFVVFDDSIVKIKNRE